MYFFNQISNYYLGQSKEKDFIEIKEVIDNKPFIHLKDKTFYFDSEDKNFNFFLSSSEYKTMDLFIDLKPENLDSWKNNDYSLPKYGITKDDIKPEKTFNTLKSIYNSRGKKFFEENKWKNEWEELMKKDEYLTKMIFIYFCGKKIKNLLLKEYDEIFEVHSISECIKKI